MKRLLTLIFVISFLAYANAQEIKKFTFPSGVKGKNFSLSNNGKVVAFSYEKDDKSYLQLNDKTYGPYEDIFNIVFSEDGSKCGFVYQQDDQNVLQVNDKIIGKFEDVEKFILSADGSITAVQFIKNGKTFISINDKELGPFDKAEDLFLSPDGKKYGFIYTISESIKYVRLNDKILGPFDNEGVYLSISKNYSSVGFNYTKDGKKFVWINDQIFGPFKYSSNPKFSSDGKTFAFAFDKDNQRFIQLNNEIVGPISRSIVSWQISDDGKKYCYPVDEKVNGLTKQNIKYLDKTFGPFNGNLRDLRISPDGSTWGIRYDKGDSIYIQIGADIKLGPFERVLYPVFAPKGSSFSFYFKKDDKWYVQIDKDIVGPVDEGKEVSFSPDGKKYYLRYSKDNVDYLKTTEGEYGPYLLLEYNVADNGSVHIAYLKSFENFVYIEKIK